MTTDKIPSTLATAKHGGCVQLGDAAERARFEAWALGECLSLHRYDSGPYSHDRTSSAWLAWQAALASRQPVGEPVAVRVTPEMRAAFRKAYREGGFWTDRLDTALDAMMLAAPPAQAVDLERFRGTVKSQYSMTEWMHRCGFVSAEKLEDSKKNHDHLLALIDSQVVDNG